MLLDAPAAELMPAAAVVQQPQQQLQQPASAAAATAMAVATWSPLTSAASAASTAPAPFCGLITSSSSQPHVQLQAQPHSFDVSVTSAAHSSRLRQLVACSGGYRSTLPPRTEHGHEVQQQQQQHTPMALHHAAAAAVASAITGPHLPLAFHTYAQQQWPTLAAAANLMASAPALTPGGVIGAAPAPTTAPGVGVGVGGGGVGGVGGGGGMRFDALDALLDQIDRMDAALLAGIGPASEAAAGEQGGLIDDAVMAELLGAQPAAEPQQQAAGPVLFVDVAMQQPPAPGSAESAAGACGWRAHGPGPQQGAALVAAHTLGGLPTRPHSAISILGDGGGGGSSPSCLDIFEATARRSQLLPPAARPPLPPLRTTAGVGGGGASGRVPFYTPSNTPSAAAAASALTGTFGGGPYGNSSTACSPLLLFGARCSNSTDRDAAAAAGMSASQQGGGRSRLGLFRVAGGASHYHSDTSSSALLCLGARPAAAALVTDAHCTLGLGELDVQQVLAGVAGCCGGDDEDMMEL